MQRCKQYVKLNYLDLKVELDSRIFCGACLTGMRNPYHQCQSYWCQISLRMPNFGSENSGLRAEYSPLSFSNCSVSSKAKRAQQHRKLLWIGLMSQYHGSLCKAKLLELIYWPINRVCFLSFCWFSSPSLYLYQYPWMSTLRVSLESGCALKGPGSNPFLYIVSSWRSYRMIFHASRGWKDGLNILAMACK
jgi:hypothetical protein